MRRNCLPDVIITHGGTIDPAAQIEAVRPIRDQIRARAGRAAGPAF